MLISKDRLEKVQNCRKFYAKLWRTWSKPIQKKWSLPSDQSFEKYRWFLATLFINGFSFLQKQGRALFTHFQSDVTKQRTLLGGCKRVSGKKTLKTTSIFFFERTFFFRSPPQFFCCPFCLNPSIFTTLIIRVLMRGDFCPSSLANQPSSLVKSLATPIKNNKKTTLKNK